MSKKVIIHISILLSLGIACGIKNNKESFKCLSCDVYLHKNNKGEFSLHYMNESQKMSEIIEPISKIYWINCKGIVSTDSTYYIISKERGISKSKGLTFDEAKEYFENYFKENQDLKFELCSSFYKLLPPRTSCR